MGKTYGGGFWDTLGSFASQAFPVIGDVFSSVMGAKSEAEARRWNEYMWRKQNAYNHPSAQMARLQSAGLNPRLIYGQSAAGATGQAGSVAPGKAVQYKLGLDKAAVNILNAKQIDAQTQNLKAMQRLNDARTIDEMAKGRMSKQLADIWDEGKEQIAKGIIADYDLKSEKLKEQIIANNIATATEADQINTIRQQLKNMVKDGILKSRQAVYQGFVNKLARQGFTTNDPKWMRVLVTKLEESGAMDEIYDFLDKNIKQGPIQTFSDFIINSFTNPFRN